MQGSCSVLAAMEWKSHNQDGHWPSSVLYTPGKKILWIEYVYDRCPVRIDCRIESAAEVESAFVACRTCARACPMEQCRAFPWAPMTKMDPNSMDPF